MKFLSEKNLKVFILIVWLAPVLIFICLLGLYEGISYCLGHGLFTVIKKSAFSAFISTISTYSVTMTGFIAAIGAYISSISHKPSYAKWRQAGYDKIFYNLYAATILVLLLIFSESIFMLLTGDSLFVLKVILLSLVVSIIQIIFLTIIIVNQSKLAQS